MVSPYVSDRPTTPDYMPGGTMHWHGSLPNEIAGDVYLGKK